MVQPLDSVDFSLFLMITLVGLLLTSDLGLISTAKDFCRNRVEKLFERNQDYDEVDIDDDYDERPLPSRVPLPFMAHVVLTSIKTELPVVEFGRSKLGANIGDGSSSAECAICLECIMGSEGIRELGNYSHLYHRDCIDGWVDEGHGTFPLCGRKLLPCKAAGGDDDDYDPWSLERMTYLLGY
ncbi:Detected protein of unknown function [Hibiscus syriacus]|uniref:RING-type domain-containing protein n=1 Tax=Hibiscus syriacus TaxID=106335 RepID=A0A6A3AA28_HIBSY|nr:E3 ubiquitin-protein ligase RHA2B-like [Hibiscus syriacus]KAE8700968.1 Detected protein of unknown function [Hibiscus syriacus]